MTTKLNLGDPFKDYEVDIIVVISDEYFGSQSVHLKTKVTVIFLDLKFLLPGVRGTLI